LEVRYKLKGFTALLDEANIFGSTEMGLTIPLKSSIASTCAPVNPYTVIFIYVALLKGSFMICDLLNKVKD